MVHYLRMNADTQMNAPEDDAYVEIAVEVFSMLADATRVRIILALRRGELSVNDLAGAVAKSPTSVSQHLAKLRLARVVATRQEGQRVFYRLVDQHAVRLVTEAVMQAEHALEDAPRHHRQGAPPDTLTHGETDA